MTKADWLDFDRSTKGYTLGIRVWEVGAAYLAMVPLWSRAMPILTRVRDLTTETVQLAVLDGFEVLYVAKVDGMHMLRLDSAVGQRLQPHATGVGKALLASLPDAALEQWMRSHPLERYTEQTITDPDLLMAELRKVRRQGFALDKEERTEGAACVAVGVLGQTGTCVAAMSVSAPAFRFEHPDRKAALRHLHAAAQELSAMLRYPKEDGRRKEDVRPHEVA
jgi:DNA-binding IclR family transcriptional regulator